MNKIFIRIKGQDTLIDLDITEIECIMQINNQDVSVFQLNSFIDENIDWTEFEEAA